MVEPKLGGYIPPEPFGLDQGAAIHEIMRLLTGSVNMLNEATGKTLCLTHDELRADGPRTAKPERVLSLLFEGEVSIAEYSQFVVAESRRNLSFFSQLRKELALCLICKKTRRYTESFLYLYRILEFISLALPFLYASTQRTFTESHGFLRGLLSDEKGSELKALEKAMPTLISGTNLALINFDFSIAGSDVDFIRALKGQLRSKVASAAMGMDFEREGDILFSVPFLSMSAFIVSLRNRMFHYRIGQANMDLGDLGGAERVLEICLNELVYWFALTFTEIVRALAKQAIRA